MSSWQERNIFFFLNDSIEILRDKEMASFKTEMSSRAKSINDKALIRHRKKSGKNDNIIQRSEDSHV